MITRYYNLDKVIPVEYMKAIVFDPFCGASGDMIIGALVNMGADFGKVKDSMESIEIGDVKVECQKVKKIDISATKVNVKSEDKGCRNVKEIAEIIKKTGLEDFIIKDSISIFKKISKAESKIHGIPEDKLVFHEVGASDAIADIIGALVAFNDLGLGKSKVYCTPISLGGGFINCVHGKLPVPAPATLEILSESNMFTRGGPVDRELLTPTGAAILSHFVKVSCEFFPDIKIEKVGYGAGSNDLDIPNVLRVVLGKANDSLIKEQIEVIETNVDDVTGEVLGNLIDRLIDLGAKDVCVIPATMKKGRSGHIIKVISESKDTSNIARKIMEETGSLGVRVMPTKHRLIALRRLDSVSIDICGVTRKVTVKIATDTKGKLIGVSAEFEDAKRVSKEFGIPVRDVLRMAEEAAGRRFF